MRLTSASMLLLSVALAVFPASAKNPPAAKGPPALVTEDDKALYALGQIISKNLEAFQLTPQELEIVKSGIENGVTGKTSTVDISKYSDKIQEMHHTRSAKLADKEKGDGQAYLTKAAAE